MKKIVLLLIFQFFVCLAYAQKKTFKERLTEKKTLYDYVGLGSKSAIGKQFVYNNLYDYNQDNAPYPYLNGRVRSGKYKSSKSAFNDYVAKFKKYKDRVYTVVDVLKIDDDPLCPCGVILAHEDGDTILYLYSLMVKEMDSMYPELWEKEYWDNINNIAKSAQNNFVNKEFVYLGSPCKDGQAELLEEKVHPRIQHIYFQNKLNKKLTMDLPLSSNVKEIPTYSVWKVTSVSPNPIPAAHFDYPFLIELKNDKLGTFITGSVLQSDVMLGLHQFFMTEPTPKSVKSLLFSRMFIEKQFLINQLRIIIEDNNNNNNNNKKTLEEKGKELKKYETEYNKLDQDDESKKVELKRKINKLVVEMNQISMSSSQKRMSIRYEKQSIEKVIDCLEFNTGSKVINIVETIYGVDHDNPDPYPFLEDLLNSLMKEK